MGTPSDPTAAVPDNWVGPDPSRWLTVCRTAVARHEQLFASVPTSAERSSYDGVGKGGDRSLVIDLQAEEIVLDELRRLHADEGHPMTVISEECGEVTMGEGGVTVVVDPIDGSLNARRTLPAHSLSIAVADGPTMDAVRFGYVYDFGARDEYVAVAGAGLALNGAPVEPVANGGDLEVVGLESAEPSWMTPLMRELEGHAYRVRVVGSVAITLSLVGAGRLDGMLTARAVRSVDAAAAQLIAREGGAHVDFGSQQLAHAGLGLDARYRLSAGCNPEAARTLLEAQQAGTRSS
ncbi:MAG: inositol monophosphatase family protein [Solirubrobacterales bacterium]